MNRSECSRLLILGVFISLLNTPSFAQSNGLLIPMPGNSQIEKAKDELKKPAPKDQSGQEQNGKNGGGTLIPLPSRIKPLPKPRVTKPEPPPEEPTAKPLIVIPPRPDPVNTGSSADFPKIPDEVVIESDSLTPPVNLPTGNDVSVSVSESSTDQFPLFPKDTSSAVFMVMKTWQCEKYDGNTLLAHAVEVYAQEAGESFEIKGLSPDQPFLLDLDEEDITLDELLDLIALKTDRDWGADVPGRTIYFYPKGIKTDGVGSW